MTRKDYVLIAAVMATERPDGNAMNYDVWRQIVGALGNALQDDNPRFDAQRFIDACNGE